MRRPLVLASASPQRRKLLRAAGVRFIVRPSRAREDHAARVSCPALVRRNALIKAQEVAGRVRKGSVVIGADTLVVAAGGRIIGKPRTLAEARRNLRDLSSRPHAVHTGVAVIDTADGRTLTAHEKTRVFMHRLSEAEIARYHEAAPPLDKAGGFDIEGRAGLFIHRIEGCHTNVIGLPMARLRLMLAQIGVRLL